MRLEDEEPGERFLGAGKSGQIMPGLQRFLCAGQNLKNGIGKAGRYYRAFDLQKGTVQGNGVWREFCAFSERWRADTWQGLYLLSWYMRKPCMNLGCQGVCNR